ARLGLTQALLRRHIERGGNRTLHREEYRLALRCVLGLVDPGGRPRESFATALKAVAEPVAQRMKAEAQRLLMLARRLAAPAVVIPAGVFQVGADPGGYAHWDRDTLTLHAWRASPDQTRDFELVAETQWVLRDVLRTRFTPQ